MRKCLAFLAFVSAAMIAVPVSAIEFRGSLMITAVNPAGVCNDFAEYFVGDHMIARYRPAGLTDNGSPTRLSIFFQTYAANYTIVGLPTSTFKNAAGHGVGSTGFTFTSQLRVTSQSPATVTNTTNFINVVGQIKDPDGSTGCTLTFRGALAKRP